MTSMSSPREFFGDAGSDAEARGGIFAVGDDQIDLALLDQVREAFTDDVAPGRTDDVTDEEGTHWVERRFR